MNSVNLSGRLTRDAELRSVGSGSVYNFGLAVEDGVAKDGTKKVMFVEVEAWDQVASGISPYLTKGKGIEVDGRLKKDEWEDKVDGSKRHTFRVVAHRIGFAPGGSGKGVDNGEESGTLVEDKPKKLAGKVSSKKVAKVTTPAPEVDEDEEDSETPF